MPPDPLAKSSLAAQWSFRPLLHWDPSLCKNAGYASNSTSATIRDSRENVKTRTQKFSSKWQLTVYRGEIKKKLHKDDDVMISPSIYTRFSIDFPFYNHLKIDRCFFFSFLALKKEFSEFRMTSGPEHPSLSTS